MYAYLYDWGTGDVDIIQQADQKQERRTVSKTRTCDGCWIRNMARAFRQRELEGVAQVRYLLSTYLLRTCFLIPTAPARTFHRFVNGCAACSKSERDCVCSKLLWTQILNTRITLTKRYFLYTTMADISSHVSSCSTRRCLILPSLTEEHPLANSTSIGGRHREAGLPIRHTGYSVQS